LLFTSFEFAIFLPSVFILYWFVFRKRVRLQNLLLLIASYIFYGWWDWRFLSLLFISSLVDYIIGIKLAENKNPKTKDYLLSVSLLFNLGFLGVFKYYNFFSDSLIFLLSQLNVYFNYSSLNIILPVGISFYTFQNLSYTIDIHKGKLKPTKDIIAFFAFAGFFPQLVAGPIERAASLLPQFLQERSFDYEKARDGLQQILWGFLKKICVADLLANQVNDIFGNFADYGGSTLALGAIFFSFQIYCDFSGYSDIAIGTAKLFNFDLMTNFNSPYLSKGIPEFWRRWHISLSTWFRDYLYIPLGGSRNTKLKTIRNILLTFTISGLWHGANWTFVIWGFLNGLYMVPSILFKKETKRNSVKVPPTSSLPKSIIQIAATYSMITFSWIFFRADYIQDAFFYIKRLFSLSLLTMPEIDFLVYFIPIIILAAIEIITHNDVFPWRRVNKLPVIGRWGVYILSALLVIIAFRQEQAFIYFQF